MPPSDVSARSTWLQRFVTDFPWVHLGLALAGSSAFLVGSLLLLAGSKRPATWLFVAGSAGMLAGNVGQLITWCERRRHQRPDER